MNILDTSGLLAKTNMLSMLRVVGCPTKTESGVHLDYGHDENIVKSAVKIEPIIKI
jgi:hypothetical protein